MRLEHRPQRRHDDVGTLARLPELSVEHLLGRVIDDGHQRLQRIRDEGEPAVQAAVKVQQLAETRPRLAPPAMAAAGSAPADQVGGLQRLLHEAIGQRHPVLAPDDLMEVPDVEPVVTLGVEPHDPLHLRHGRAPRRGRAAPVIEQALEPVVFIPPAQAPHGARAHAQNLGHVDPRLPLLQGLYQDLVHLHGPLHRSLGIGHPHLLGGDDNSAACWERSDHLLSGADRSCAPDTLARCRLTRSFSR